MSSQPIAHVDVRVAGARRSGITYETRTRRVVRTEGWVITQLRDGDGWLNLRVVRDR